MYNVIFNDASTYEIPALPWQTVITKKGKDIAVLCIPCPKEMSLDDVKNVFGDSLHTSVMTFTEDNNEVRKDFDFIELQQIIYESDEDYFVVKLSQAVQYDVELFALKKSFADVSNLINSMNTSIDSTNNMLQTVSDSNDAISRKVDIIEDSMKPTDPNTLDLPNLKTYLINQSKINLETYLNSNPITSFVHGNVGKRYSISSEKQSYLMAMIMMAQNYEARRQESMKVYYDETYSKSAESPLCTFEEFVVGVDNDTIDLGNIAFPKYQVSWNATGEACTYDWTVKELIILASEIEAVVRPLVSKQQQMEVDIKNADTIEAAKAIDITF